MLTPKQLKVIKSMVSDELTQKEIAEAVKITEQTICNWKKDPEFMREYNRLLNIEIQSTAGEAFKVQKKLLAAKSETVQHLAAKDILDRAGYKPKDNISVETDAKVVIIDDIGDGADETE